MNARYGRIPVGGLAVGLVVAAVLWSSGPATGQPVPAQVLGNDSYLRTFLVFKTPVYVTADGQVKTALDPMAKEPTPLADFQSALPPNDWMQPDFDDSRWDLERAPVEVGPGGATGRSHAARHTATPNSLICLRGRFVVDDPARVNDLKLTLEYVGGVAIYVNGKEIARAHLPAGPLATDTLADRYPDDLYCEPGGSFLQDIRKNPEGFARRYRRLTDLAIPASALRKGANVLAIQVHRAPINEAAIQASRVPVGGMYVVPGIWSYAAVRSLSLTAGPGSAVVPNVARPAGVQVFNCLPYQTVQAFDYGNAGEPLRPIRIPAARNGVFSGRLVVSSDQPIRGLRVTVSDLAGAGGGRIASAAVRVRAAGPAVPGKSWAPPFRYDGLPDAVPAEAQVVQAALPRETYLGQPVARTNLSAGAVVPIWLTVRVPADAAPGEYRGTVTVSADGLAATGVPVVVAVGGWTLADPQAGRIRNLGFTSPETLARHYGVPLWSDRHFELMGRTLALMAEVRSRQVIVELAIGFHGSASNEESVIRWIRQPDGSFTHDFTLFDRYLDVVAESVGKPLPLRLNCWGEVKDGKWVNVQTVSLLDPATGQLSPLEQPDPGTPEHLAFWKPVLDEVRRRVEARGWFDVTSVGHNSYCWEPNPQVVSTYKQIWPDGVWSYTAHNGRLGASFKGAGPGDSMPVPYSECVWTEGRLTARGYSALLKDRRGIWVSVARNRHRDYSPLTVLRDLPEEMIMRGHDGVGQLGADIFPLTRTPGRYFHPAVGRGGLGPDCSTLALLAPGPDGPIPTERFEMLREGIQIAEAILFLQRAVEQKRIPEDLLRRVDDCLNERAEAFLQRWSAGRFERDERLWSLAGEVADKLADR